jgi:hypothetical protein
MIRVSERRTHFSGLAIYRSDESGGGLATLPRPAISLVAVLFLRSYAFRGGNSILREQGEKLLLRDNERDAYHAYAVIALVTSDYERVRDALRQLIKERWGYFAPRFP